MTLPEDGWLSGQFNIIKTWPTHVKPATVKVGTNQPTRVTTSPTGVRTSSTQGDIRTTWDLTYPPMKLQDFAPFRAIISACQGQWNSLRLPLDILSDRPRDATHTVTDNLATTTQAIALGSTLFKVSGLDANDPYALEAGQFISITDPALRDGYLAMVLADAATDGSGNCEFRITHPVKSTLPVGSIIDTQPQTVLVSISSDTHQYDIDTAEYYYLKISFISTNYYSSVPTPTASPTPAPTSAPTHSKPFGPVYANTPLPLPPIPVDYGGIASWATNYPGNVIGYYSTYDYASACSIGLKDVQRDIDVNDPPCNPYGPAEAFTGSSEYEGNAGLRHYCTPNQFSDIYVDMLVEYKEMVRFFDTETTQELCVVNGIKIGKSATMKITGGVPNKPFSWNTNGVAFGGYLGSGNPVYGEFDSSGEFMIEGIFVPAALVNDMPFAEFSITFDWSFDVETPPCGRGNYGQYVKSSPMTFVAYHESVDLTAEPTARTTQVNWTASSDPTVTGYEIQVIPPSPFVGQTVTSASTEVSYSSDVISLDNYRIKATGPLLPSDALTTPPVIRLYHLATRTITPTPSPTPAPTPTPSPTPAPSLLVTPTTWNPADAGTAVTLSNGDLTAASNYSGMVRSIYGAASGKYYWEMTSDDISYLPIVGVALSTGQLTGYPGRYGDAWGFYGYNGSGYPGIIANYGTTTSYGDPWLSTSDVFGFALDMDAGTLTIYKNGVSMGTAVTGLTGTIYAAFGGASSGPNSYVTANFGASAFAYTVPTGYRQGFGAPL